MSVLMTKMKIPKGHNNWVIKFFLALSLWLQFFQLLFLSPDFKFRSFPSSHLDKSFHVLGGFVEPTTEMQYYAGFSGKTAILSFRGSQTVQVSFFITTAELLAYLLTVFFFSPFYHFYLQKQQLLPCRQWCSAVLILTYL